MAGHTILSSFSCFYRTIFNNRIVTGLQHPIVRFKSEFTQNVDAPEVPKKSSIRSKSEPEQNLDIPQPPKRPPTSYLRFLSNRRPVLKEQHPDWKPMDINVQCGVEWRSLDLDLKKQYEDASQKGWEVYRNERIQYMNSLTEDQVHALSRSSEAKKISTHKRLLKQLQRAESRPKRPLSGFVFFIMEKKRLPGNEKKSLKETLQSYGAEWKKLTSDEKHKYNLLQQASKERYAMELEQWEKKMASEGKECITRKDNQAPIYEQKKLRELVEKAKLDKKSEH